MATAAGASSSDHGDTDVTGRLVTFPCDLPEWPEIRRKLKTLLQIQSLGAATQTLHEVFQLVHPEPASTDPSARTPKNVFQGLHKFYGDASPEEKDHLLQKTLPSIVQRALEIAMLRPETGLAFNRQQEACRVELSRRLVASIVACGFLCLFPGRRLSKQSSFNAINFDQFFLHLGNSAQQAKMRCIMQYFDRLAESPSGPQGNMIFKRQVTPPSDLSAVDDWQSCDVTLCDVKVHEEGIIEDSGPACVQVDFANKKTGGAVLCTGRVQEEIRFSCCPELISCMLFMEAMDDNEAIVVEGFETYSSYTGYAKSLQFGGPYLDPAVVGPDGNLLTKLCCIDALPAGRIGGAEKQYHTQWVLRELNKSLTGFSDSSSVAPPGECTSEPETDRPIFARNARESGNSPLPDHDLTQFAAGEAASIITTAAEQAVSLFTQRKPPSADTKTPPKPLRRHPTISDSESSSSDQLSGSPVDHDRSWQFMARRRSSNLSDSSRRSSCSTRSTTTTEFSSEFEEYYESFQKRERNLKDTTIQEEDVAATTVAATAHPAVMEEFAQSLLAGIFKQGMSTASSLGVQKFGEVLPAHAAVKPVAVRPQPRQPLATPPVAIGNSRVDESSKLDQASGGITDDQKGDIISYVDNLMDATMKSSREHVQAHADNQENIQVQIANDFVNHIFLQVMQDPSVLNRAAAARGSDCPTTRSSPKEGATQGRRRNTHPAVLQPQDESMLSVPGKRFGGAHHKRRCTSPGCLGAGSTDHRSVTAGFSAALENSNLSDDQKANLMSGVSSSSQSRSSSNTPSGGETDNNAATRSKALVPQKVDDLYSNVVQRIEQLADDIMNCAISEVGDAISGSGGAATTPQPQVDVAGCLDDNMLELLEVYVEDLLNSVFEEVGMDLLEEADRRSAMAIQVEVEEEEVDPELFEFADDFISKVMQDAMLIFERDFFPDGRRRYSEQRNIEEAWIRPLERFRTNSQYFIAEFSPRDLTRPLFRRASLDETHRMQSGFQNLMLSDFEDELRKSNPSIPHLRLLDPEEVKPLYKRRASEPAHLIGRSENVERLKRYCSTDSTSSREIILDWLNSSLHTDSRVASTGQRRHRRHRTTSSHLDWFAQDVLLEAFNGAFVQMFGNMCTLVPSSDTPSDIPPVDHHNNNIPGGLETYVGDLVDSIFRGGVLGAQDFLNRGVRGHSRGQRPENNEDEADYVTDDGNVISFSTLVDAATQLANQVIDEAVAIVTSDGAVKTKQKAISKGCHGKPIATGNWGCGAYRGDPQLKAMLQWASTSRSAAPLLVYYTFGNDNLHRFGDVVRKLQGQHVTVGQLLRFVFSYCKRRVTTRGRDPRDDLFTAILREDIA